MNDRESKAVVCSVGVIGAFGLTLHILWGISLLTQKADWGNAVMALAALFAAWTYLGVRLSSLPSETSFRFDEAMPHLLRVVLPFCVPSAITTCLLLSSGLLGLHTSFVMVWGTVLIVVVPVSVCACLWIRRRCAASEVPSSQVTRVG